MNKTTHTVSLTFGCSGYKTSKSVVLKTDLTGFDLIRKAIQHLNEQLSDKCYDKGDDTHILLRDKFKKIKVITVYADTNTEEWLLDLLIKAEIKKKKPKPKPKYVDIDSDAMREEPEPKRFQVAVVK